MHRTPRSRCGSRSNVTGAGSVIQSVRRHHAYDHSHQVLAKGWSYTAVYCRRDFHISPLRNDSLQAAISQRYSHRCRFAAFFRPRPWWPLVRRTQSCRRERGMGIARFVHFDCFTRMMPNEVTSANAGERLGFAEKSRVGLSPWPGVAAFCRLLRREVASTTAERGLFLTQPCLSRQVFYGSRRLAGGASHCQGSEASQTM